MSGCYGSSDEDKYFEDKLLDHTDPWCDTCESYDCEEDHEKEEEK